MPKLSDHRNLRILSITTLVMVLLLTCIHRAAANQAQSPELLPFGVAVGDVRVRTCDDCAAGPVNLYVPFTFIGTEYRQIYVNSNGVLSFERSFTSCCGSRSFPRHSPPLIAPYWHDFNPRVGGNIYYRQTNDSQLLQLYHIHLSRALATKGLDSFFPTLLFIATWDQVAQYSGSPQVNNTLQVVLATDGVQTLAVFIYKDINWGQRAQIGFNVGDGYTAFVFPEALSDQTLDMDESSNVGKLGVYIHRINKPPLLKLSGIFNIPFGVNTSDVPGPPGDDSSSKPLTLRVPFPFFGREYNTIIVNSNGILSFNTPFTSCCPPRDFPMVSPPLIAPFWLDFDLTGINEGGIYYRQTNDSIDLEFIHSLLMNASVGDLVNFFPTQLFIATWDKVPQYQNSGSTVVHNTFQVLLSTDGNQTVSIFIYHRVTWGLGAQIGFNAGDGYTSFTFPEALSDQTLSIDQHSNIGEPGVFVYRIDVPPDQAHTLTVESSEPTSISISWRPPTLTSLQVLYYIINANNLNSTSTVVGDNNIITQVNTTSNVVLYNVTGLLPGTTYELTVVTVSLDIYRPETGASMSQPSNSVMTTTGFTVPALSCDAPVSSNGVITVTWSYIHTGGLPLTNVFLTYTNSILGNSTGNFSNCSQLNVISVSSVDSTSIVVPSLVTGAEYMFNVSAENSYGSSSIICGPTPHLIGLPTTPVIGEQISGPNGGEITISLATSSSGINGQSSDSEVFWFVVIPVHEGIEGESVSHLSMNYQSGSLEKVVVSGLMEGESYTLNVTAINVYGSSQVATSMSIAAGQSATITGAVVGGAVGGGIILLLVIVLLLILILILMKVSVVRRGKTEIGNVESVLMNRVASVRIKRSDLESEAVYEEPGSLPRHIQPVSLRNSDGSMFQLEDCPAYGASTLANS